MFKPARYWPLLVAALVLSACTSAATLGPKDPTAQDVAELAAAFRALGPQVSPEEATRAARVSFQAASRLAIAYEITDPPLVHNSKVNRGLKPRGLCRHWAEDMEARLKQEDFSTLTLHRAIANANATFRYEHSSVIISAAGRPMMDGIVVDPWRAGGRLTWVNARDDRSYPWKPRLEVQRQRGLVRYRQPDGTLSRLPAP